MRRIIIGRWRPIDAAQDAGPDRPAVRRRAAGRCAPGGADAASQPGRVRRPGGADRRGRRAEPGGEARLPAVHGAVGPAGLRQDHPGAAAGRALGGHLASAVGGDQRSRRCARPRGRCEGAASAGRAHSCLHRRAASVQQGPAGRTAAACRGRDHHPDRGHHREPVLRAQLAPPVAAARLPAGAAGRGGAAGHRRAGADGGARAGWAHVPDG